MDSRVLDSRPCRAAGVEEIQVAGAPTFTTVLKDPSTGVLLEVEPAERELWRLLDGTRTVRELIAAALLTPEPAGPDQVGRTLLRFGRAGFLGPEMAAEAAPRSRSTISVTLPAAPDIVRKSCGALALAILVIPLLAGIPSYFSTLRAGGLALVQMGGSPLSALLTLGAFVWFRAFCQLLVTLATGFRLPRAGIDFRVILPIPYLDLSRLELAERKHQAWVALSGLWSPLALASAACAAAAWSPALEMDVYARQAAAIGLLFVVMDASPLFEWNGYRLYRAAVDHELARDRALAYFARCFLVDAFGPGAMSAEQRRITTYGAVVLVWAASALKLGAFAFRATAVPMVMAIFQSGSFPVQTLLLFMLFVSGALLLYALLHFLSIPVVLLGEETRREILSRMTVPAAVLASAAGLLWNAPMGQVLLHTAYAALLAGIWNRYRAVYRGTSVVFGFDLLVLYFGLRAIFLLPAALLASSATFLGFEVSPGHRLLLDGLGLLPIAAAPFFAAHAVRAGLSRFEAALSGAVALLILLAVTPGWSDGAPAALLLEYAGTVACATALIQLLLVDSASPMARAWRLVYAGFVALAAAGVLEINGTDGLHAAALPLQTAALLPVASGIFAGAFLLRGPFRGRERHARDDADVTRSASAMIFGTLSDIAVQTLGRRRALAVVQRSLWNEQEGDDALRHAYALRVAALERHGGRALRAAAEHAASTGLYWPEWETANRRIFPRSRMVGGPEDLIGLLGDIPLFALLSGEERGRVAAILKRDQFPASGRVLRRGDPGDRFYVVHSGELDVLGTDLSGTERPVARLIAGDCFGELALLPESAGVRTASVDAITEAELLSLERDEFLALFPVESSQRDSIVSIIRHGSFLRRVPFFSRLPPAVLSRLASKLVPARGEPGSTLEPPASLAPAMLVVREGKLEAAAEGSKPALISEGGICCEGYAAGGLAVPVRLVPVEPTQVLWLGGADFRKEIELYLDPIRTVEELSRPRGYE